MESSLRSRKSDTDRPSSRDAPGHGIPSSWLAAVYFQLVNISNTIPTSGQQHWFIQSPNSCTSTPELSPPRSIEKRTSFSSFCEQDGDSSLVVTTVCTTSPFLQLKNLQVKLTVALTRTEPPNQWNPRHHRGTVYHHPPGGVEATPSAV